MVSEPGVVIVRQDVKAVAGIDRNIPVSAAGGIAGSNGTRPRRVTPKVKVRRYAHFDEPLTAEQISALVLTPVRVARHPFFPLLGYEKVKRKVDFSVFPPLITEKGRAIRYAGHEDSAIYAEYARQLSEKYEKHLELVGCSESVLAYRSGIGYNVPFAKALFDEICRLRSCTVICLDIAGFFDNLQHERLKAALATVLGVTRLPEDWFKIYQRLTAFEYVERSDIENAIGRVRGRRVCSVETFRKSIRPLIQQNPKDHGIPQGTPLSGLLANLYMSKFDHAVHAHVTAIGGSYRRYSDDIALVVPAGVSSDDVLDFVVAQIAAVGLSLNDGKTSITTFSDEGGKLLYAGVKLQYLGFTFDGTKTLIRSESVKSYYARMKANIRRYVRTAAKKGITLSELRKRVLIGRFTHWGDDRNFVQYAYRAARELKSPEIKRQLRNHVKIFDDQWARAIARHSN